MRASFQCSCRNQSRKNSARVPYPQKKSAFDDHEAQGEEAHRTQDTTSTEDKSTAHTQQRQIEVRKSFAFEP